MSRPSTETVEISAALLQRLTDTLCYAAQLARNLPGLLSGSGVVDVGGAVGGYLV